MTVSPFDPPYNQPQFFPHISGLPDDARTAKGDHSSLSSSQGGLRTIRSHPESSAALLCPFKQVATRNNLILRTEGDRETKDILIGELC